MVARSRGLKDRFGVSGSSSATLREGAAFSSEARTRSDDARPDDRTRVADVADDGAIMAPRAAPARRGGTRGEARRDARARAAAGRRAVGIDAARATERTVMATRPALSAMWVQISIRRDATTTGWNVFTRSSRMAAVFGRFFSRNELG
jgi:hypothetical protein